MDSVTIDIRLGIKEVVRRLKEMLTYTEEVKSEKNYGDTGGGGWMWYKRKIRTYYDARNKEVTYRATYIPMPPDHIFPLVYHRQGGAKKLGGAYE